MKELLTLQTIPVFKFFLISNLILIFSYNLAIRVFGSAQNQPVEASYLLSFNIQINATASLMERFSLTSRYDE